MVARRHLINGRAAGCPLAARGAPRDRATRQLQGTHSRDTWQSGGRKLPQCTM